jgi:hypothetical protein
MGEALPQESAGCETTNLDAPPRHDRRAAPRNAGHIAENATKGSDC